MKIRYLFVLPMLLPLALWAQSSTDNDGASSANAEVSNNFGSQTRAWVDLQTNGNQSVKKTPPLSGDVATHIYQRYVKSFDHPIPDQFARENFVQGGSGGSQ